MLSPDLNHQMQHPGGVLLARARPSDTIIFYPKGEKMQTNLGGTYTKNDGFDRIYVMPPITQPSETSIFANVENTDKSGRYLPKENAHFWVCVSYIET